MILGHIGDMTISVINVYFPNKEKDMFLNQIVKTITNDAKGLILMGGRLQYGSKQTYWICTFQIMDHRQGKLEC